MANTNWENLPSTNTPINDENLNKISAGIVNIGTSVDSSYRTNIIKSKNLFNANNVLNGMGIASGGTITDATDNGLFYIPVVAGKTYVFSFTDNGVSGNVVWGYTSVVPTNGVYCTYNATTNASLNGATFTPTGTQKYLCIRLNTTANNQYNAMSNIQCEEGNTATTYEPYITPSIVVDNEEIYNQNIMNYSTNEQVIGKWIDGKPIYRKTVSGTTVTSGNRVELQTNVDKLIDYNVVVKNGTANQYHPVSFGMCSSQSTHANPIFLGGTTATTAYLYITTSAYTSQPFYGWIEYTKTTD